MADTTAAFTKMVPGFDFLQGLAKNASAALPNVGQWIAPTLNPEEVERQIDKLRVVQFWLEQNTRMVGATIQALEVQRMTLSTLKTMNVSVGDLRESMTLRMPDVAAKLAAAAGKATRANKPAQAARATPAAAPSAVVDPMQWWGALTQQFTQLAATALRDEAGRMPAAATDRQAANTTTAAAKKASSGRKRMARARQT